MTFTLIRDLLPEAVDPPKVSAHDFRVKIMGGSRAGDDLYQVYEVTAPFSIRSVADDVFEKLNNVFHEWKHRRELPHEDLRLAFERIDDMKSDRHINRLLIAFDATDLPNAKMVNAIVLVMVRWALSNLGSVAESKTSETGLDDETDVGMIFHPSKDRKCPEKHLEAVDRPLTEQSVVTIDDYDIEQLPSRVRLQPVYTITPKDSQLGGEYLDDFVNEIAWHHGGRDCWRAFPELRDLIDRIESATYISRDGFAEIRTANTDPLTKLQLRALFRRYLVLRQGLVTEALGRGPRSYVAAHERPYLTLDDFKIKYDTQGISCDGQYEITINLSRLKTSGDQRVARAMLSKFGRGKRVGTKINKRTRVNLEQFYDRCGYIGYSSEPPMVCIFPEQDDPPTMASVRAALGQFLELEQPRRKDAELTESFKELANVVIGDLTFTQRKHNGVDIDYGDNEAAMMMVTLFKTFVEMFKMDGQDSLELGREVLERVSFIYHDRAGIFTAYTLADDPLPAAALRGVVGLFIERYKRLPLFQKAAQLEESKRTLASDYFKITESIVDRRREFGRPSTSPVYMVAPRGWFRKKREAKALMEELADNFTMYTGGFARDEDFGDTEQLFDRIAMMYNYGPELKVIGADVDPITLGGVKTLLQIMLDKYT